MKDVGRFSIVGAFFVFNSTGDIVNALRKVRSNDACNCSRARIVRICENTRDAEPVVFDLCTIFCKHIFWFCEFNSSRTFTGILQLKAKSSMHVHIFCGEHAKGLWLH